MFRAPNGNSDGATVGYVNLTEGQRVIAYFGTNDITQADTEDLIKTRDEKSFPVTVTFEGAGDLAGTIPVLAQLPKMVPRLLRLAIGRRAMSMSMQASTAARTLQSAR